MTARGGPEPSMAAGASLLGFRYYSRKLLVEKGLAPPQLNPKLRLE